MNLHMNTQFPVTNNLIHLNHAAVGPWPQVTSDAVKKFAEENVNVQKGAVAAERLYEVLNMKPSIQDGAGAVDLASFKESIEFRDVWFR